MSLAEESGMDLQEVVGHILSFGSSLIYCNSRVCVDNKTTEWCTSYCLNVWTFAQLQVFVMRNCKREVPRSARLSRREQMEVPPCTPLRPMCGRAPVGI
jgi:hypothetical protein